MIAKIPISLKRSCNSFMTTSSLKFSHRIRVYFVSRTLKLFLNNLFLRTYLLFFNRRSSLKHIFTYFSKPKINALNLTSPSVTASSLLILNTNSFKDFVIGPKTEQPILVLYANISI